MTRKFFLIGLLMLSLGLLGITAHATAATVVVTIPAGAEACAPDYNSACAFTPNPLTIDSGDSVQWSDITGTAPHSATSDDHADNLVLDQPVAPANSFSTTFIFPAGSSVVIGPFITAVMQTKLYHCTLHAGTMKGTLIIMPASATTSTTLPSQTTTTTTTTTTTLRPPITTTTMTTTTTVTTTTTTTSTTLFGQTTTTFTTTTYTTTTSSSTFPPQRPCALGASVSIGPASPLTPGTSSMIGVNMFVATNVPEPGNSASLSMSDNGAGGILNPSSFASTFGGSSAFFSVSYTPPNSPLPSITLSVSGTISTHGSGGSGGCLGTSFNVSSAETFPVVTVPPTDCNDMDKGKDKDKGKDHDKRKCKGHGKDKDKGKS